MATRRDEALDLSGELLTDIELSRIPPTDIARRAFRVARLLDDDDAMAWLGFEISGYPDPLTSDGWAAAGRSNRHGPPAVRDPTKPDDVRAYTSSLGQLQAEIDGALAQIAAATDPPVSISSANPGQWVSAPDGNSKERAVMRSYAGQQKALLDRVVGAIHLYVTERHQELRFGNAVESAFEVVRGEVDAAFAVLVPDGPQKLAAAFENAASDNPEHWAGAAATCRRLLKAAADALRPPGPPVNGRHMTDDAYINRLIDWIVIRSRSDTAAAMITADLEYLGRRLDAANDAGHKGAHTEVDRFDASRFVTGTYLLLGDVLRLGADANDDQAL